MAAKLKTRHLTELTFVADPRLAPSAAGERPTRAVATVTDVLPGEGKQPPRYPLAPGTRRPARGRAGGTPAHPHGG
jgi:hypothetical protein